MKARFVPTVLVVVGLLALPALAAEHEHKAGGGKDVTVQGEILDLACYTSHGAKGAEHASCAMKCVKAGQPMGLLSTDGTVYLLFADHQDAKAYEKAKDLAGKNAEVAGEPASQGSLKGITVHGVKAL